MGLDVELLDSGCCGMAGSWGFEAGHYEVSMACGERALLPKVRELDADDARRRRRLLLQDADRAGRSAGKALHVAQVLKLARGGDPWEQPRGRRSIGPVAVALAVGTGLSLSRRIKRH